MKINDANKLKEIPIAKEYLQEKNFNYKVYLWLCYNSWWDKVQDDDFIRYEFKINYINYKELEKLSGISKSTFSKHLINKPYRLKFDEFGSKHIMLYSPKNNFISIKSEIVNKILNCDEMTIRSYIFLKSLTGKEIHITNKKLLEKIGYSPKSRNNETKLLQSIRNLEDLGLISKDYSYENCKKYSIYHKLKQ